jgi:hypothetical protein
VIGYVQIPVGAVGPIVLDGKDYYYHFQEQYHKSIDSQE